MLGAGKRPVKTVANACTASASSRLAAPFPPDAVPPLHCLSYPFHPRPAAAEFEVLLPIEYFESSWAGVFVTLDLEGQR